MLHRRFRSRRLSSQRLATRPLPAFRLSVERLEDRRLLASLTPGNILASNTHSGSALLYEFTVEGQLVQQFTIPSPGGADNPRDVVVSSNGQVQIYNGTFNPSLSTLDPQTGIFADRSFAGWSTVNNLTYGGITAGGDYIFATDMETAGKEAKGVLRVNINDFMFTRFATDLNPIDVNMGNDGLLYILNSGAPNAGGTRIDVYNPDTLAFQRTITLPREHRAIDVTAAGHIYAVNPDIYHYDSNGVLVGQPLDVAVGGLADIDVDVDGRILVASHGGDVVITDTGLANWRVFTTRVSNTMNFAGFVTTSRGLPKAASDVFQVGQNSQDNVLDVLANDQTDSSLTIFGFSTPDHGGQLSITADQKLQYSPAAGFTGIERFTYTAADTANKRDKALVLVRVTANNKLVAQDDNYQANEDQPLIVNAALGVLANDSLSGNFNTGPFQAGNIVVSNTHSGDGRLYEYTPTGVQVRDIPIQTFGSTEATRDLTFDRNGNVQIYNGTFHPRLTTYHSGTAEVSQTLFAGWSTANNLTYGGLSAFGDYVFASDIKIAFETEQEKGVVRFNVKDHTVQRFGESDGETIDVAVGLDGLVYALVGAGSPSGTAVKIYNPETLALIRTVPLPREHRAVNADADGNIYGAFRGAAIGTSRLFKYDSNGNELIERDLNGMGGLDDVDITPSGTVMVSSHGGEIAITDTTLTNVNVFNTRPSNNTSFAAFVQPPVGTSVNGSLKVKSHTQPGHGTVTVAADGSFTYTPEADFFGQDSFTYVVEDGEGATAQATVRIQVANVNDAPLLTPGSPQASTDEDSNVTLALTSFINQGVGSTIISDVDTGDPLGGIAVYGQQSGPGSWQYSLDGSSFQAFGGVDTTAARLLPRTAQLRYLPNGDQGGSATLQYYAWDTTSGVAGNTADVSDRGGDKAFSTSGDTLTLTISDRNDAPVLTPANPLMGNTNEETTFTVVLNQFVVGITDVDVGAVLGGIAITAASGNGTWSYSLNGSDFVTLPAVGPTTSLLLERDDSLRFTPDQKNGGEARITYRAWDTTSGSAGQTVDTTTNGGTTAFSTNTDTAKLTVDHENDAPVITPANPSMGTVDEETIITKQLHTFLSGISDVDQNAVVGGIAVTGLSGKGTWSYSLDGTNYINLTGASETSALLLERDDFLRYTPDFRNGETADIMYRAWDTTSGAAGGRADSTVNGGSTAFSVIQDTAQVTVTPVNDAPVLTAAAPSAGTTNEDTPVNIQLSSFVVGITDVDEGAVIGGIAVTAGSGRGIWSYSLDGTNFTPVGNVSQAASLLLRRDDWLRYEPDNLNGELPTVTYRAWDTSSGVAGTKVHTGSNGAATPFSTATDTATLTVSPVNDAPRLEAGAPTATTDEDTVLTLPLTEFINKAGSSSTTIHDDDLGGVLGGIAIIGATGSGRWQFSLDGSNFQDLGAVSQTAARLLPADAALRLLPEVQNAAVAGVSYLAWDTTAGTAGGTIDASFNGGTTSLSTDGDSLSVTINAVNDAPILTVTGPTLTTNENTPITRQVSEFINAGAGTTQIEDVDDNAVPAGIALIGKTGNGVYTYSLDGQNFLAVGNVTNQNALLLAPTASIRYFPIGENGETATLSFRGWDRTQGQSGDRTDAGNHGGSTPYSSNSDVLNIVVQDVNDPPTALDLNPTSVNENTPGGTVGTLTVTDPDNGDTHTFTVNDTRFHAVGNQLKLKDGVTLNHEVEPQVTLNITATDSGNLQINRSFTIDVGDLNDAPTVDKGLQDQTVFAKLPMQYTFAADAFDDEDPGDTLTYAASLVGGAALPAWLSFSPATRRFSGTPSDTDTTPVDVSVTATDPGNLSVSAQFKITIDPNPFPWQNPRNPLDVNDKDGVTPIDVLLVINYINAHPGDASLPQPPAVPPPYYDVSGDNQITPIDVLLVINAINNAGGEGEARAEQRRDAWSAVAEPAVANQRRLQAVADLIRGDVAPPASYLVGASADAAITSLWGEDLDRKLEALLAELETDAKAHGDQL